MSQSTQALHGHVHTHKYVLQERLAKASNKRTVGNRSLDLDSVTWKATWMSRKSIFYECEDKLWIPLLELWGVVSYTSLLVLRQFGSKQFILDTYGLNQMEFSYRGSGYVNS